MRRVSEWQWFRNLTAPVSAPASGAYLYGEGDQIKVKQASGLTFALAPSAGIDSGAVYDGGDFSTNHSGNFKFDAGTWT